MTKEEIQSAKSLCEQATEGPWDGGPVHIDVEGPPLTQEQFVEWMSENANAGIDGPFWSVVQPVTGLHTAIIGNGPTSAANAAFIASSRTLLPKALNALDEAHREIEELKNRVHVVLDCNSFKREGRHWSGCPFYFAESTT